MIELSFLYAMLVWHSHWYALSFVILLNSAITLGKIIADPDDADNHIKILGVFYIWMSVVVLLTLGLKYLFGG